MIQEVEQQRTTIADLEKRLADAEADAEARRKEAEEEKVMSLFNICPLLRYHTTLSFGFYHPNQARTLAPLA